MIRSRYTWLFAAAIVVLTLAALASFREISALSAVAERDDGTPRWLDDTLPASIEQPIAPTYAALAAEDAGWRREHARQYTLGELRARGDGRRSPRQAMQDRTFMFTRRGDRGRAIAELVRWVDSNPRDGEALLWLARLHNEAGQSRESIKRYRQALALAGSR